jgi:hypothetical protein
VWEARFKVQSKEGNKLDFCVFVVALVSLPATQGSCKAPPRTDACSLTVSAQRQRVATLPVGTAGRANDLVGTVAGLSQAAAVLANGRQAAHLTVLVHGVHNPVDARVSADRGVAGIHEDDLEVLVGGVLGRRATQANEASQGDAQLTTGAWEAGSPSVDAVALLPAADTPRPQRARQQGSHWTRGAGATLPAPSRLDVRVAKRAHEWGLSAQATHLVDPVRVQHAQVAASLADALLRN